MRRRIPTKFDKRTITDLISPSTTALIAFRLGTADTQHYHDLAVSQSIAYRIAEAVPRHRPALPDIQKSLDALNAIFGRRQGPEGPWFAEPDEITHIENGTRIYEALLLTTPGEVVARAIHRVHRDALAASA